jgi:hypothetical protein
MATYTWDVNGDARAALDTVVREHGVAGLSSSQILVSMLKDLLPDSPRESNVLAAAAEADVAGMLRDRLAHHVSAQAAVTQAAQLLEERTALAPDACEWAARQMAEAIGLTVADADVPPRPAPETVTWPPPPGDQDTLPGRQPPGPSPGPVPPPVPPPGTPPPAGSRAAILAAGAALVCALSVPLQLVVHGGVPMWYGWFMALSGATLFTGGVLTLLGGSRRLGAGLIFGAALAMVPNFIENSVSSGGGGGFVAASVITTVTAVAAATISIVYLAREIRTGSLRAPLAVAYCLAALGLIVAFIPGDVQYQSGPDWLTVNGLVGAGVHGRFLFAGIVAIVAIIPPAVIPGLLPHGSGAQAGVIAGWLAIGAAGLVEVTLVAVQPTVRAATALYAFWAVWGVTVALGIALLASGRARRAVNAPPTVVTGAPE